MQLRGTQGEGEGMGWPLRMFEEEGYYFVTSRCFQGRLLLRPSQEVNEVVGGVLAKAVQATRRSRRWMTRRWWAGCAPSSRTE
jgi:hypothetical protein